MERTFSGSVGGLTNRLLDQAGFKACLDLATTDLKTLPGSLQTAERAATETFGMFHEHPIFIGRSLPNVVFNYRYVPRLLRLTIFSCALATSLAAKPRFAPAEWRQKQRFGKTKLLQCAV